MVNLETKPENAFFLIVVAQKENALNSKRGKYFKSDLNTFF